jgi:hypothetical protein
MSVVIRKPMLRVAARVGTRDGQRSDGALYGDKICGGESLIVHVRFSAVTIANSGTTEL